MGEPIPTPDATRVEPDGSDPGAPPRIPYLHMWTGPDAQSRLNLAAMAGFGLASVGGKAAPQWMRPFPGAVESVLFVVLPVGWVGEWHESPKPQWVVPLKGRWFLETMDGSRVEMGPGDLHFGQDQGTEGGRGHRSGQVGDEPCVQILIQFGASPAARTPNPFGG